MTDPATDRKRLAKAIRKLNLADCDEAAAIAIPEGPA